MIPSVIGIKPSLNSLREANRMRSFLSYWKPATADSNLGAREEPLRHIASNQYHRLARGDEVFVATTRAGRLILLGKVVVGRIVDQATAEAYLGSQLWESSHHVLSEPGTESPLIEVDITPSADKLRFLGSRDRLALDDGQVDAKQLQTMRELSPQSAAELDATLQPAR